MENEAGGIIGVVLALIGAGAGAFLWQFLTKPQKGGKRRKLPKEKPRPDVKPLEREAAKADQRAQDTREDVGKAVEGKGTPDNPHGLADSLKRRR